MNSPSKKILAAAVLASFTGLSQAAGPTLGDVLKNSGIDVTGYIDTSYTSFSTDTPTYRAYDTEKNSFNLHAVDLTVSSLPSKGFGGLAELTLGTDADINGALGSNKTDNVDLLQAFVQFADGPVTGIAGKFTTLAGAEVTSAPSNINFSRSLLYTYAIPISHTGLRATYTVGDNLKFIAGYNNGWDVLKESNTGNCVSTTNCADGKTVELGVISTISKMFGLNASIYSGEELSSSNTSIGTRTLVDVVATINITDAMSVIVNFDSGEQENAIGTNTKAKWEGIAGYFNYKFNDQWKASLRAEELNDKNCFRTGCSTTSQKLKEVTATVAYSPAKSVELRGEVRSDRSNQSVFTEDGTTKKSQDSFGVEAIYKF